MVRGDGANTRIVCDYRECQGIHSLTHLSRLTAVDLHASLAKPGSWAHEPSRDVVVLYRDNYCPNLLGLADGTGPMECLSCSRESISEQDSPPLTDDMVCFINSEVAFLL